MRSNDKRPTYSELAEEVDRLRAELGRPRSAEAEAAFRESEGRFRQLAENIRAVLWLSDPAFTHLYYVSPMYEVVWGRSLESAYEDPTSFLAGIHPEDREHIAQLIGNRIEDYGDEEFRVIRPDGSLRWVHSRGFPIKNQKGEAYRLAGISEDITDRRQMELDLESLDELRREFVANVSHELRTPLTAIRGYAETLLGGALEKRDTAQDFIRVIHNHAVRLERLTHDLLQLSEIEDSQLVLDRRPVRVQELIDLCLDTVRSDCEAKRLECEVACPEDLPPLDCDSFRMRQVIQNLIDNAVRYCPEESRISIELCVSGENMELLVKDNGPGIPEDAQQYLFERFYRVDATRSRELGGTGLGLSVTKRLVELHGGSISVESQIGKGSAFTVSIPLKI